MTNYYVSDMEVSKQLVELELKNRKYMLSLFDKVIETMSKFNDKKVNKRIDTALKKIDKNLSFSMEYNSFIIKLWYEDRSVTKTMDDGYGRAYYLKNNYETLVHCYVVHSSYGDGVVNDDGRLIFESLKEQLLKSKEYIEKSIVEIENQLSQVDDIISEYQELIDKCNKFNNKLNWCIAEYYNIKRF